MENFAFGEISGGWNKADLRWTKLSLIKLKLLKEKDYETTFKVATEAPLDPVLKMVISTVEGIPTGDDPSSDTGKFPRN